MPQKLPEIDLAKANEELASLSAQERIAWAHKAFCGGVILSSSFGLQSAIMLHLANTGIPGIPVIFVDTGYLFPETHIYSRDLEKLLGLNIKLYTSPVTPSRQEALDGQLWKQGKEGLERYGLVRKVEPMSRALREHNATCWLTGLRRGQSSTRKNLPFIELQNRTYKVYPIIDWDDAKVMTHMLLHDLPSHPLTREGYVTLGDTHSTARIEKGMTAEDTRYGGLKFECGLHEGGRGDDFVI